MPSYTVPGPPAYYPGMNIVEAIEHFGAKMARPTKKITIADGENLINLIRVLS